MVGGLLAAVGGEIVDSPVEALHKLRDEAVSTRRKLVDQGESIQNVQAEIGAIDCALSDEVRLAEPTPQAPEDPHIATR